MSDKGPTYPIDSEAENSDDDIDESKDDDTRINLSRLVEICQRQFPKPRSITRFTLTHGLENLASLNQGKELPGTPNAELAFQFFKQQSKPWRQIADYHLTQVQDASKAFVDHLFGSVVGANDDTIEAILKGCADPFFD